MNLKFIFAALTLVAAAAPLTHASESTGDRFTVERSESFDEEWDEYEEIQQRQRPCEVHCGHRRPHILPYPDQYLANPIVRGGVCSVIPRRFAGVDGWYIVSNLNQGAELSSGTRANAYMLPQIRQNLMRDGFCVSFAN